MWNMIPSCQTLSKTPDISKKTLLTSMVGFSSKTIWVSWIIDNYWAILESPGGKPDWQGVEILVLRKYLKTQLALYNSSKDFPKKRK